MTLLIFVKCGNVCFIGGYLWLISLLMVLNYSLFYYPIFCFFDLLMRTSKRHCSSVVIQWCHLHPNGGGRGLLMNWWMQELVVNPMMHHKMQVVNTVLYVCTYAYNWIGSNIQICNTPWTVICCLMVYHPSLLVVAYSLTTHICCMCASPDLFLECLPLGTRLIPHSGQRTLPSLHPPRGS